MKRQLHRVVNIRNLLWVRPVENQCISCLTRFVSCRQSLLLPCAKPFAKCTYCKIRTRDKNEIIFWILSNRKDVNKETIKLPLKFCSIESPSMRKESKNTVVCSQITRVYTKNSTVHTPGKFIAILGWIEKQMKRQLHGWSTFETFVQKALGERVIIFTGLTHKRSSAAESRSIHIKEAYPILALPLLFQRSLLSCSSWRNRSSRLRNPTSGPNHNTTFSWLSEFCLEHPRHQSAGLGCSEQNPHFRMVAEAYTHWNRQKIYAIESLLKTYIKVQQGHTQG